MTDLYSVLSKLGITYNEVEHPPVFTVKESQMIKSKIDGTGCKNLLLADSHKANYLLVMIEESKRADLRKIAHTVGLSHLSFASSDELYNILHQHPGGVSPFGILYDKDNRVTLLIDADLQGKKLLCHPNDNMKTIAIQYDDLIKFIKYTNHSMHISKMN